MLTVSRSAVDFSGLGGHLGWTITQWKRVLWSDEYERVHIRTLQSLWLKRHLAVKGSKYTFLMLPLRQRRRRSIILDEYHLYVQLHRPEQPSIT